MTVSDNAIVADGPSACGIFPVFSAPDHMPLHNTQLFALPASPPDVLEMSGATYALTRVFKHDFWAATCLYEEKNKNQNAGYKKIVVKFGRSQDFCGLPLVWAGERLADHEEAIYRALRGVVGVPRWVARLGPVCYAVEYIQAAPLDHVGAPPEGFFDKLKKIFEAIHARGVAYGDANKRSNILVRPGGEPVLIDFQISLRRRDDWFWPLCAFARRAVAYLAERDLHHLYKHKRRLAPGELTPDEDALSRRRGLLHRLHRRATKPYRALRRRFLRTQYEQGRLVSPTADLEDHHQPEKQTWRDPAK
jgi:hypothetical protein